MRRFAKLLSILLAVALLAQAGLPAVAAEQLPEPETAEDFLLTSMSAEVLPAEILPAALSEDADNTETAAEEEQAAAEIPDIAGAPETAVGDGEAAEEFRQEETVPEEAIPEETVSEEKVPEETAPAQTEEPEIITVHNVPQYFQTDYPDNMYGYGTIASSGCSVTCLAMVATYLTGHSYLPDQLARYFGGRAVNNMARLEYGSDAMQLPYTRNTNFHETLAALKEGKIAIALLNEQSAFTASQHFVVLTGITEDGKILVNDPYMPNYGKPELELGFVDGFAPGYISNGYAGGWVYDPAAMPEEPFLYYEEEPERPEPRYPDIHLTLEQRQLLAKVIWVEARGESFEGQQAVAEVVFNRMVSEGFSNTLEGVIFAEGQFRSVEFLDEAQPYQTQYEAIEAALYGPYVLPIDVVHFATFYTNENVWGQIGGHIFCYQG